MKNWKLKRVKQCEKCPWKVSTNPLEIPNGYTVEKHKALKSTISDPNNPLSFIQQKQLKVMACHETHNAHCIGWIYNQINQGNNIALRLQMLSCENYSQLEIEGKQHEKFEDTIPVLQ